MTLHPGIIILIFAVITIIVLYNLGVYKKKEKYFDNSNSDDFSNYGIVPDDYVDEQADNIFDDFILRRDRVVDPSIDMTLKVYPNTESVDKCLNTCNSSELCIGGSWSPDGQCTLMMPEDFTKDSCRNIKWQPYINANSFVYKDCR